ncbi:MAG: VOC family protein [Treponema sp.]|jgi:lactoylglutathione lyase|nr:VOC family protein [Treponema sp.]
MKPRLAHIALRAGDVEKTAAFYREVLGFPEAFRMHGPGDPGSPPVLTGIYLYIAESQFIEIFPGGLDRRPEGPGLTGPVHFCIEVDDAAAALEEIRLRGAPVDKELATGYSRCRQFWTHDPDGNAIEFMELTPESLQQGANERLAASPAG